MSDTNTTPMLLTVMIRAELDEVTVPTGIDARERAIARFQHELSAHLRSTIDDAFVRDPDDGSTLGGYDGICVTGANTTVTVHPQQTGPAVLDGNAAHQLLALINERLEVAELNLQQIATMPNPPAHTQAIVAEELARWGRARENILRAQGAAAVLTDDDIEAFFQDE